MKALREGDMEKETVSDSINKMRLETCDTWHLSVAFRLVFIYVRGVTSKDGLNDIKTIGEKIGINSIAGRKAVISQALLT